MNMIGRHGLGVAYGYIKAFDLSFPTSKKILSLRLARLTCLKYMYARENTE